MTFTALGPDTVEGWVGQLTSNAKFSVSEPELIDLGGRQAVRIDLSLAAGESEVILFREGWGEYYVSPGRRNRLWIVEVGGEVVLIATDAATMVFDKWVARVEEVLSTITWSE